MLYVGIDIGKLSHFVALWLGSGKPAIFKISVNQKGFFKLLERLKEYSGNEILIGMEATGHYFLSIYEFLLNHGYQQNLVVLNPLQVQAFRNTNLRGGKTDKIDSFKICQILAFGQYQTSRVIKDEVLTLRELTRFRTDLVDEVASIKKRLLSVLDRIFPEFAGQFSHVFGKAALRLLERYPVPEEIAALSTKKLSQLLQKNSQGRFRKAKAEEIHRLASNSIGIKLGINAFKIETQILIERIRHLEKQIEKLNKEITKLVPSENPIFTIPGIGSSTGGSILAEIGDISTFKSSDKLVAFAGIDPKLRESGKWKGKTPISKRGPRYLRRAIFQASIVTLRVSPMFKAIYQRQREKGKPHKYSVIAVSNKLARVIYSVLKNNKPFQEESEIIGQ